MIRYDSQTSPRDERVPEGGECPGQLVLFSVHRHAERLEEAREVAGTRAGPQRLANGVYEVVAGKEGTPGAPADDAPGQLPGARFIGVLLERLPQTFLAPGIQNVGRGDTGPG